jgi:DsbE subfamily thiol:disulfide oxidoreductase
MKPEHRVFAVPPQPVTDAAIHTNLLNDLYAVIGEPDGKGGYVTRFYHNPLVPWIFLGAVVIALGGFISLGNRRNGNGLTPPPLRGRLGGGSVKQYQHSVLAERPPPLTPPSRGGEPHRSHTHRLSLIPLTAFAVLAGFFVWRLALIEQGRTPELVPSVLIGKPTPAFNLPPLLPGAPNLKTTDLKGKVTLLNFFASWCVPCRAEHPVLATLKDVKGLTLVGIDYEDKPEAARDWLKKAGNPYAALAADRDGHAGIDFGLTGVPESYLIDKQGVIRFKQTGPLTPEIVQMQILPLAAELNR